MESLPLGCQVCKDVAAAKLDPTGLDPHMDPKWTRDRVDVADPAECRTFAEAGCQTAVAEPEKPLAPKRRRGFGCCRPNTRVSPDAYVYDPAPV